MKYNPNKIERKWQKKWENMPEIWQAQEKSEKKKFYCLVEFPYPSGEGLHVGHVRSYAALDIMCRKKRMQGFNVLYPMGWDAFGLPTENYAIKTGIMPQKATEKNIKRFKKQMQSLGLSFDWSREINTTDPSYYKWTQWIFLKMFENGLAYKAKIDINWCPSCKIGLANEEAVDNKCERCGTEVEKKKKEQWLLKITKYADRLIDDLDKVNYSEKIKTMQINWIGRSDGAEIEFKGYRQNFEGNLPKAKMQQEEYSIPVFTTRPDTIFGATFIVMSPEHPLVEQITAPDRLVEVKKYIEQTKKIKDIDRLNAEREKTGVFTGATVINPLTEQEIPVWIADYVLSNYGTGSIMAVPGHDERDYEFAKKFGLEIIEVIAPNRIDEKNPPRQGKKVIERQNVHVIVRNPKDGKFICLKWKKQPWITFPMGGVEKGEDIIEAARREVLEETGYKNLKYVKTLGGTIRAEYFAAHKDENRVAYTNAVMFDLLDEEKQEIAQEELEAHEVIWLSKNEINYPKVVHAELNDWLLRWDAENFVCTEKGVLINSDKYNGLTSKEAAQKITGFLESKNQGKQKTNFHLRDWVFSRQHYWGEPIPIVFCENCGRKDLKTKLSISFYIQDIWQAILNGQKTIETRALNPEEPERYFGSINSGDYVEFVNKNTGELKIALIKNVYKFKNLEELFNDKITLEKVMSKKMPKTLKDLENAYDDLAKGYLEKINKNGLVAWEFDLVDISKPIPVPEKELPVELPKVKKYQPTDTGESPLSAISKWVNTKCPVCGGDAKRETDTMPNWAGSSWYFLRYTDPHNSEKFADKEKMDYFMPVDLYNGGMEHVNLHLLYSRFWHKFLFDIKMTSRSEPYMRRIAHGMILAENGMKMSKSKGNVINPDDVCQEFGADTLRVYEMFMGPYDEAIPWDTQGIKGVKRFLERVWQLLELTSVEADDNIEKLLHKTIKKVTEDIDEMKFNTAVSQMMIFVNEVYKIKKITKEQLHKFILLISVFAPHLAEEMWESFGFAKSVFLSEWPSFDPSKVIDDQIEIPIQINGKLRDKIMVKADLPEDEIKKQAIATEKVKNSLQGREVRKIIFIKGRLVNIVV